MVINTSAVGMAAKTSKSVTYTQKQATLMSNKQNGSKMYNENTFEFTFGKSMEGSCDYPEDGLNYNKQGRLKDDKHNDKRDKHQACDVSPNENKIKNMLASQIDNVNGRKLTEEEKHQEIIRQLREFLSSIRQRIYDYLTGKNSYLHYGNSVMDVSSGDNVQIWDRVNYSSFEYREVETLDYESKGKVVTADGREIEFNMTLSLSREFVSVSEDMYRDKVAIMTDPLVISLDDAPISVSDQKWLFDIDGDGKNDEISMLKEGSAFLCYDKNNDGIINDGGELFGAKSGNGFADLAAYDEDGNGWIDEADSIYDKLSVWQKDTSGRDEIMSLKDAGVGAIFLGNMQTEYGLKSEDNNNQQAQIRRSGMYLSEDGRARSIQQLDMVKALIS